MEALHVQGQKTVFQVHFYEKEKWPTQMPTKAFLQSRPDMTKLFSPSSWTHPSPLVLLYLPRNIVHRCTCTPQLYTMKLKVSQPRYATSGLKAKTTSSIWSALICSLSKLPSPCSKFNCGSALSVAGCHKGTPNTISPQNHVKGCNLGNNENVNITSDGGACSGLPQLCQTNNQ